MVVAVIIYVTLFLDYLIILIFFQILLVTTFAVCIALVPAAYLKLPVDILHPASVGLLHPDNCISGIYS